MKATLEVELKPFQTPNFVSAAGLPGKREDGIQETQSYPLSDLDPHTLAKMCDQYRSEVFKKAGKVPPPEVGPACPKCGC